MAVHNIRIMVAAVLMAAGLGVGLQANAQICTSCTSKTVNWPGSACCVNLGTTATASGSGSGGAKELEITCSGVCGGDSDRVAVGQGTTNSGTVKCEQSTVGTVTISCPSTATKVVVHISDV